MNLEEKVTSWFETTVPDLCRGSMWFLSNALGWDCD